ncbi:MAG: hypothetical protein H6750_01615 [Nitrospiraceae bacterium]|nr:hypothetical protein [Nitrospiraceae bacterium]
MLTRLDAAADAMERYGRSDIIIAERGSQGTSHVLPEWLKAQGIAISM